MKQSLRQQSVKWLMNAGTRFLPFADAATDELPLGRLLRLSLFQVTVGMAMALTFGTLNRVMIVELGVPTTLVAVMVAMPLIFAPFRALVGFKSDTHKSALGWKRVPYIWFGTLAQFGGLALMPFALIVLTGDNGAPVLLGQIAAAIAFLLIGAGMQTVQTAGLALATDLAPESARPRVVALMYVMLLVGLFFSSFIFGALLVDFSPKELIQIIQGAAAVTMAVNVIALWKQEPRQRGGTPGRAADEPDFKASWKSFIAVPGTARFLIAVALGTAAFNMQDVLLEPYGGQVLGMAVSQTSILTGMIGGGSLLAFALAAHLLMRGRDPYRLAGHALLVGLPGFMMVILAALIASPFLFQIGAVVIGFGSGLFAVSTLVAAMGLETRARTGLALGAWGAVQATAAGIGIALSGPARDAMQYLAAHDMLGPTLTGPAVSYGAVYLFEIVLLFAGLAAIGPLATHVANGRSRERQEGRFGLSEFPT
jgi:MFS transporter, BCD family, chlorophyll transporter